MGLERRGGNFYFYRKARRGGRVVSEYIGGGPAAPLMARLEAMDRERDRASREAWKASQNRMDADDVEAASLFDRVEALARLALEAAGYHQHKRGEWRRRRGKKA